MKHILTLGLALGGIWLLWSGHFEPFVLGLGVASVVICLLIAKRMRIIDEEGTPMLVGMRPLAYTLWLWKEIARANVQVAGFILDPRLPIRPRMVCIQSHQKSELGRVILANSITLTPGTVSVDLEGNQIWVHVLDGRDANDDWAADMDRRVCQLER